MADKILEEQPKHIEAFETYYALKETRSYQQVADKLSVSITSVKKWAKSFNWSERVQLRDIEAKKQLEKQAIKSVVNEKANYRKIVQTAIGDFVRRLARGDIEIKTAKDLDTLVKLDLLLMGESTENITHTHQEKELPEWLAGDDDAQELVMQLHRRRTERIRQGTSKE